MTERKNSPIPAFVIPEAEFKSPVDSFDRTYEFGNEINRGNYVSAMMSTFVYSRGGSMSQSICIAYLTQNSGFSSHSIKNYVSAGGFEILNQGEQEHIHAAVQRVPKHSDTLKSFTPDIVGKSFDLQLQLAIPNKETMYKLNVLTGGGKDMSPQDFLEALRRKIADERRIPTSTKQF